MRTDKTSYVTLEENMIVIGSGLTTSTTTNSVCNGCAFRTATGCLLVSSSGHYRPQSCPYFQPYQGKTQRHIIRNI